MSVAAKNRINSDVWYIANSAKSFGYVENNPVLESIFSFLSDSCDRNYEVDEFVKILSVGCRRWQCSQNITPLPLKEVLEEMYGMKLYSDFDDNDMFDSLLKDIGVIAILIKFPMLERIYVYRQQDEVEFWVCVKEQERSTRLKYIMEVASYCKANDLKNVNCLFVDSDQIEIEDMPKPLYYLEKKGQ